jgi:hypothetical protein
MFILKSEAYIYKHNIEHEFINRLDILKTDQLEVAFIALNALIFKYLL